MKCIAVVVNCLGAQNGSLDVPLSSVIYKILSQVLLLRAIVYDIFERGRQKLYLISR